MPHGRTIWLRYAHLAMGVAGPLTFLWTGRFMLRHFPAAYRGHEEIRFLYRANHFYIMFASILNVVIGRHVRIEESWRLRRALLVVSSLAILLAVPVLIAAFYLEPPLPGAVRWTTLLGCVLVFGGGVLSIVATRSRSEL